MRGTIPKTIPQNDDSDEAYIKGMQTKLQIQKVEMKGESHHVHG